MKRKLLLLAMCITSMAWLTAYAGETEPNDTKATANTLALNTSNTGAVGIAGDADWWKVTTTGDGKLDLTLAISNGLNAWCQLYDNDGTTLLGQGYTAGTAMVVSKDGLAAGTYYLKIYAFYAAELPAYTITNALTQPVQANDSEPNNTKAQAKTLNLNNDKTGHINYYYNNLKDSFDWYKVTTNADGRLRITMTSHNTQNVWAELYDNDGTTQLAASYTAGSAVVVNKDGLAAGTYYIRVRTFYTSEWAPYTIADSLFVPTEPNDTEPNDTKAQALTLGLNGSVTGHINYYYNLLRDGYDWYKVTTNADGRLRLTMTSGNGQNVWAELYDNDGTTQLAGSYTAGSAVVVNKDGLAAGTYYIRVRTFYTSEWAPYTLADSLFTPTQANDNEPNDTKAQAKTLALNGSKTGHTNYYYNGLKDEYDWYKVTTTEDGTLQINITSHNGQNVWAYLYDNDGTTLLNSGYSTSSTSHITDGLAAGTYYIRINTFYNSEWAPYTVSNTFTGYAYTNDNASEPNDYFSQAKIIPSNGSVTGHINFYYNGTANSEDNWKINYSGAGNMTLVFDQNNRNKYGDAVPTWIRVYRDTTASPVYSNYFYGTSGNINLAGLSEGYYYIKVFTYYTGNLVHFSAYRITNSYTEVAPKPKSAEGDTATTCQSKNTVAFKVAKSSGPFAVQLYRYGVAYGSPISVPDKKKFSFKNLPQGSYYITAQAEGSTIIATSKEVEVMPEPTGTSTSGITNTQAVANWTVLSCAKYYNVQYRVHGTLDWTKKKTNGNVGNYTIKNLTANTQYDWQVSAVDSANGADANSAYTDSLVFTTLTLDGSFAKSGSSNGSSNTLSGNLNIYPNPVVSYFVIQLSTNIKGNVGATLKDINGKAVWTMSNTNAQALQNKQVSVSNLQPGTYFLQVIDEGGRAMTKKIIVSK